MGAKENTGFAAAPARRPVRERLWFWPAALSCGYLLIALTLLGLSYRSEMAKIDRGTFSDTVSPYFGLNVVTYPVSSFRGFFSPYPIVFKSAQFRDHVNAAVVPGLINIVLQTGLLALLTLFVVLSVRKPVGKRAMF